MRLAPLAFAFLLTSLGARAGEPITLSQAMADPDWIGPPVEDLWWRWDGKAAQYTLKRKGASTRDTWQVAVDGGAPAMIEGSARADLDTSGAVFDAGGTRSAFVRNGDVFVRDLRSGALVQLTRGNEAASRLRATAIESHVGAWCDALAEGRSVDAEAEWRAIREGAHLARGLGLEVHAGHGLNYETAETISALPEVVELNIGHFLVGEAVFIGLGESVRRMRAAMDKARAEAVGGRSA